MLQSFQLMVDNLTNIKDAKRAQMGSFFFLKVSCSLLLVGIGYGHPFTLRFDFTTIVRYNEWSAHHKGGGLLVFNRLTKKTKIAMLGSLLYVLLPTDFIPDFIVGFGQVDDAAVLLYLGKCLYNDLAGKKYRDNVIKG